MIKTTVYRLRSPKIKRRLRIALVSDLHDAPSCEVVKKLIKAEPDVVAVVGDLTSRLDCIEGDVPTNDTGKAARHSGAFELLRAAASLAPTYYSLGNHELCGHYYRQNVGRVCRAENLELIKQSGAVLLDDHFVDTESGIRVGGLTSGHTNADLVPKTDWLDEFCNTDGFKLLLCHHPEYYPKYLRGLDVDLILSGHAHGGQIRLFGRGLYAPGQGVLPKYTSGIFDGRMVVGRGLANTGGIIPRLFNRRELVLIDVDQ